MRGSESSWGPGAAGHRRPGPGPTSARRHGRPGARPRPWRPRRPRPRAGAPPPLLPLPGASLCGRWPPRLAPRRPNTVAPVRAQVEGFKPYRGGEELRRARAAFAGSSAALGPDAVRPPCRAPPLSTHASKLASSLSRLWVKCITALCNPRY